MTPPQKTNISSDFTDLVLGIAPETLPTAPLPLPGVEIGKPVGAPEDVYTAAANNAQLKPYLDGAQSDPVAYLEAWKKNWWGGPEADKLKKDHVARDSFLSVAFVAYHQSKKPDEKAKLLTIILQATRDSL